MRRPKTNRVPRTRAGGEWTEASFWAYLRSHLRLMSRRWPPRAQAMKSSRRQYIGPNKRQKWEVQCVHCFRWLKLSECQVDHIVPCGQLRSFNDLPGFVERLLCEADGFQVLCKECHKEK